MARFDSSSRGTLARLRGVHFKDIHGREWTCDLRVVSVDDDEAVIRRGLAASRIDGGSPDSKTPLYDFACAVERVALAAVDSESSDDKPEAFFPNGAKDVRTWLDRETIVFLAKAQERFQERLSPLRRQFNSVDEYNLAVVTVAALEDGDEDPFVDWAPSLRMSFERSMAVQLLTSLRSRSLATSAASSAPATTNSSASSST